MISEGSLEKGGEEKAFGFVLCSLSMRDFRNYMSERIEPAPGINLVCGANAQGKTSLLEAVSLISTGRLLRASRDSVAIRHGQDSAKVQGELAGPGTLIAVELHRGARKRVELNGLGLPRASDVIGRLPTVSFSASDLSIVTGDPSDRRQFLDWELAQLYPSYLRHLSVYKRALEQRNALLKQAQQGYVPGEVFEPWEDQLAKQGAAIRIARRDWIEEIQPLTAEAHSAMGGGEQITLAYEAKDSGVDAAELAAELLRTRPIDVHRGSTSSGPHRDELIIMVNETEARSYGSQGQQRTAVIALKLAVLESVEAHLGSSPVLLLDDVFSDLDASRRTNLVERTVHRGGQVFVTCTEAEQAGTELSRLARVFRVESGQVVEP